MSSFIGTSIGVNRMYITARERQILELLLSIDQEITVSDLARKINVSSRTIHRDLKDVEDILHQYELSLLKKSGVGIQIIGESEQIENLKLFLFNVNHNQYTADERQMIILCTLLESTEPVKLIAIANDLNVTIATISNDLNKVEEQLRKLSNLELIRKRGYGVEIVGDESSKRKAMSKIISENVDEFELLSLIRENIQKKTTQQHDSISERLLGLVDKNNLLIVERAVGEINKELPYSIADSAYMGLVVHLALAMERILRGENISIDQGYLDKLNVTPEFKVAGKIIDKLEKVFQIAIPEAEKGYITMHLRGAKLRLDKEYLIEDTSLQLALKAKSLIAYIGKRVHQDLSDNRSLLQGLVAHLSPALFRIKQNMEISNPLLERIKSDYHELFLMLQEGVEIIFPDIDVPDEEIGYLVMHFGSVLIERQERKSLSALVVCSSGIGTSKMLAMRVQREIPEIKECKNVSLFELHQMDYKQYDLILSTIRLPEIEKGYIVVNPILSVDEIEKVKAYIQQHFKTQVVEYVKDPMELALPAFTTKEQTLGFMQSLSRFTDSIATVLKGFTLINSTEIVNIPQVLDNICDYLLEQGRITDKKAVIHELVEREKLGGLGIPDTKLALYHAKSNAVKEPTFIAQTLIQPLTIQAMDSSIMDVETILLLVAPETIHQAGLEVLSQISASIIENEQSIQLFESKDEQNISVYLASKLNQFFYEKLNELRSV